MSADKAYSDEDVFASLALREWEVDAEDDARDFERYNESAQNELLWFPAADRQLSMPTQGYYVRGWPQGAVVHFTAGRSLRGDADAEATIKFGSAKSHCYFCISTTGKVYQTAPLNRWGSHAGDSQYPGLGKWVSSKLVGIEVCNAGRVKRTDRGYEPSWNTPGAASNTYFQEPDVRTVTAGDNILVAGSFHKYTPEQEASLFDLLLWLHRSNPAVFNLDFVLGHDEVSPHRKADPGGALSMTMPLLRRALKDGLQNFQLPVAAYSGPGGSAAAQVASSAAEAATHFENHGGDGGPSRTGPDFEALRQAAGIAVLTEDEIDQARGVRDFEEEKSRLLETRRPPHQVPNFTDDQVRDLISDEARVKIIEFEVSSETYYRKAYERPILPGVQSGITVGIGYDLGYNSPEKVRRDFDGLVPAADIESLTTVCRLKGDSARPYLDGLRRRISIPWEAAREVFRRATLPRFGRDVLRVFPNAVELKGHAFGMLVSLVYNRGSSLGGDRRREMLAIRELMAERRWAEVPEQFRAMKRLWRDDPKARGLLKRRDIEAAMFERGLQLMQRAAVAGKDGAPHEGLSIADPATLEGDGYHYRELDETAEALERRSPNWDKVVWPADDARSPDYSHIPDRPLPGSAFSFGPRELELLIEANAFEPSREHGRIVFALRGAELVDGLDNPRPLSPQENREALLLREVRPDHRSFRCVAGVYDLERGRLYGYTASTVPNPKAVASFVGGGDPSNMMLTGCYQFQVGWHQESRPRTRIPGCLIEAGRRKAVLRTKNNHTYELTDIVQDTTPGDNVHPGKSEGPFPFSSWGCLVLKGSVEPVRDGDRANVKHTGEWALFRKALGLPERGIGGHGRKLDVLLLTGLDAVIANRARHNGLDPRGQVFREQLHRLRQGSRSWRVGKLRTALGLPAGDVFTAEVAAKLAELQRAKTGGVHGLYAPQMDAVLGLDVFMAEPQVAMLERRRDGAAAADRDQLAFELGAEFEASRGGRRLSEDAAHEGLVAKAAELGTKALITTGNVLLREAELVLRSYVCEQDAIGRQVDRDAIRKRVDDAAKTSTNALKHVLVTVLRQVTFSYVSYELMERVVGFILDQILLPTTGQAGDAVVGRLDGGIAWLCSTWAQRLAKQAAPATVPLAHGLPRQDDNTASSTTTPTRGGPSSGAPVSSQAALLLGQMQVAAGCDDVAGVRSSIHQLRDHLRSSSERLTPDQHDQFLDILCDSRFIAQFSGSAGRDPYILLADIEDALDEKKNPDLDRATVESRVRQLCEVLGDARIKILPERIEKTIKALRKRRLPELISLLADRLLTREPDAALLGRIGPHYALSLIDSQRIVAGIEILNATLEKGQLSADSLAEVWGGLGRAHKQIYVNHVKSTSDAIALKLSMEQQLTRAIDAYGELYDPAHPHANYWHGINLIALLKRAHADRAAIGSRHDPDALARGLIEAIEPGSADTTDHYKLATLGEAYLAGGNIERASFFYARFADHPNADAFALNSAVRQLEEVWRLQVGPSGADTLLVGLKAALAQKENGRIVLSMKERRAIAAGARVGHQEHFESRTKGGKFMPLAYLKLVVETGMAVAAVKQKPDRGAQHVAGAGETVGTGFLIDGAVFGLPAGNRYLLTNAHVLWDPERAPKGMEDGALTPEMAEIVFEAADGHTEAYACKSILWQSPSGLHDACLLEIDREVKGIKPLAVADAKAPLIPDDGSGRKGTRLSVVGHPEGGALSIGFAGSLEDIAARLVDKGPRGASGEPVYLHYSVPTEPGNSGSPVIEVERWQVVGLHHAGFNETHGRPRLGGRAGSHHANEGICIQSIRAAVKEHNTGKKRRRGWFG